MPIIKQRQTLLDFTCQYSGTMESLFDVAVLNSKGITEDVAPGTLLRAPRTDEKVIAVFEDDPTLDITTDKGVNPLLGGIDYMGLLIDFIVS